MNVYKNDHKRLKNKFKNKKPTTILKQNKQHTLRFTTTKLNTSIQQFENNNFIHVMKTLQSDIIKKQNFNFFEFTILITYY